MPWNRNRVLVYRQSPPPDAPGDGKVRSRIEASPARVRVGIWDLDATAGALPTLLDRIDECQQRFSFSSVEAPFPTGLTSPGVGVAADWHRRTGQWMDPEHAGLNVAARPIFEAAGPVLEKLPIEWLVVVVKSMIADTTQEESWLNLFATSSGNVILISTYEVREYAAEAKRSFEAAVFGIALSALLAAMVPQIEYQSKSTGSIFDFCENRADIVKSIRAPHIDAENRKVLPGDLLEPVARMLEVLEHYKGGAALRQQAPATRKSRAPAVPPAAATVGDLKTSVNADNIFRSTLESLSATLHAMAASKPAAERSSQPKAAKRTAKRGATMSTSVLVFVPGTIGSELFDAQGRVWPGSLLEALTKFDDQKFQRLLAPNLTPGDIIRSAAGGFVPIYRPWIEAFEAIQRGGVQLFREHPSAGLPKTLRPFPYDWRLDLQTTADALAAFLDDILTTIADADIQLVCHSQGGMLGRLYLESGKFDKRPAFSRVSLFATFGTPHNGAPIAFAAAAGLHKAEFLTTKQTQTLVNDSGCPSLYQLFPATDHSFIWDSRKPSAIASIPADDATLVANLGLSQANLGKWRDFRKGLTGRRPPHVRYFYVVGSRQQTLVRFVWDGKKSLEKQELDDAGDGTVSLLAAMDLATQSEFVGKSHVTLIETRQARETFASVFGGVTLFAAGEEFSLSVRKPVVTVDEPIHVQIECLRAPDRLKSTLRFQRADIQDPAAPPESPTFIDVSFTPVIPIDVTSVGLEFLNLKTPPIQTRGIYRAVLIPDGGLPVSGPEFVVQQI